MELSSLVVILMVFLSSSTPILSCKHCHHHHKPTGKPKPPISGGILPPIHLPSVPIPPVTVPSIKPPKLLPPVPITKGKPCPPPPPAAKKDTCPIDTLKLGACVSGLVHIGLGEPVIEKCCPILAGLVEIEAAACLCTTLKMKALNLNMYAPLAIQLLITCGKTPPSGYTCSI